MKRASGAARDYPRTARLNHLVHEIVAEEVERLDDDRLGFLTVVGVEVEPDLRHAVVWYTTLDDDAAGDAGADETPGRVAEALDDHRGRIRAAIGRQARLKRTPELAFRPDVVIRQAERVEQILRDIGEGGAGEKSAVEDLVDGSGAGEVRTGGPVAAGGLGAGEVGTGGPVAAGGSGAGDVGTGDPVPEAGPATADTGAGDPGSTVGPGVGDVGAGGPGPAGAGAGR
jgi:ribosome-binding factor A